MSRKLLVKNFLFLFVSQVIAFSFNLLISFVFPKFMSVEDYGFWQLFLFYAGYVGFFHFGLNDGLYLRYGGKIPNKINKELVFAQFLLLILMQIIVSLILWFFGNLIFSSRGEDYIYIILLTIFFLNISNLSSYWTSLMQSLNMIKLFSKITIFINVLLFASFLFAFANDYFDYKGYVWLYVLAYSIGLIVYVLLFKSFIRVSLSRDKLQLYWQEFKKNVFTGSNLMISNIAALFIIGIGRLIVELNWGISTFAKLSLAFALMGLFVFFVKQISIVLFPFLRRKNDEFLKEIFEKMNVFLSVVLLLVLLFFPIVNFFIENWISRYSASIYYLIFIFPICIFEGKMQVLYSTFMKVLRYERRLMYVNIIAMVFAILFSGIGYLMNSIHIVIISSTLSLALRSVILDYTLKKHYRSVGKFDELFVVFLAMCFIILFLNLDYLLASILYFALILPYAFSKRNELHQFALILKNKRL